MKNKTISIAVIQTNTTDDISQNIINIKKLLNKKQSKQADFVMLPECCHFRKIKRSPLKGEPIPGPFTKELAKIAKQNKQHVLIGSLFEHSDNAKFYNTSVLLSPDGEIQSTYRKIHLFDAIIGGIRLYESDYFLPGNKPVMTEVKGFKLGLSICYDIRYPELYRKYFDNNVDIICIPSSFTYKTGELHWETLCRARAIENQAYVCAPNQYGIGSGQVNTYGHSMIVDPKGKVCAIADDHTDQILTLKIEKSKILMTRNQMPCHLHKTID